MSNPDQFRYLNRQTLRLVLGSSYIVEGSIADNTVLFDENVLNSMTDTNVTSSATQNDSVATEQDENSSLLNELELNSEDSPVQTENVSDHGLSPLNMADMPGNDNSKSTQEDMTSFFRQVIADKGKTFQNEEDKKEAEKRLAKALKMFTISDPKKKNPGEITPGKPPAEVEKQKEHMNLFYSRGEPS